MFVLAHLSDVHLDGSQRSADRTRAVMDHLNALPYDLTAVLVTGDIADHGLPAEYREARELLASRHPVLICPGNHDSRAPFREVLLGEPSSNSNPNPNSNSTGPVNQLHRTPGLVVALCDSSIPGKDEGRLDDETLAWLETALAETPAGTPVLLAFHHPPALLHSPFIDAIRQFDEERLAELVTRHPNIAALLCGHAHSPAATTFAGRPLLVAPGVVSTLNLPWDEGEVVDLSLPPALAFHVLDDTGRLTTHYRVIPL